jgi:prepilin peptidase CpaA
LLGFFGFFAAVLFAAGSDAISFRIPNAASLILVLLYPLHVLVSPVPVDWFWGLVVGLGMFGGGLALFAVRLFGGGDVKFFAAIALWAGPKLLLPLLAVMAIAGGVLAVAVLTLHFVRRYGPSGAVGLLMHFRTMPARLISGQARPADLVPPTGVSPPRVPYGIAIAAGAIYVGIHMVIK